MPDAGASAEACVLLARWSQLHAVRTALSLVALALLLWQLCVASQFLQVLCRRGESVHETSDNAHYPWR